MITSIDIPESKTIELVINGTVTAQDELDTANHLQRRAKDWGKFKVLENIQSLKGVDFRAFWHNLQMSKKHMKHIERLAIVTNQKWIELLTKAAAPFMGTPVKVFQPAQIKQARAWLKNRDR